MKKMNNQCLKPAMSVWHDGRVSCFIRKTESRYWQRSSCKTTK